MATIVSTSDSKKVSEGRFAISRASCEPASGVACADVSAATSWSDAELGNQKVRGLSTETDGALIVTGGGTGIGDSLDQFHVTYQRVTGDVDIVARLLTIDGDHPLAMAGLMIRGTLETTAAHASLLGEVSRPVIFRRRLSDGWTSIVTTTRSSSMGSWLKLERRGELVSAYTSDDGANWVFVGSDLVALSDEAFVGFAVASHQPNEVATAIFDSVSVVTLDGASGQTNSSSTEKPDSPDAPPPGGATQPPADTGGTSTPPPTPPVVETPPVTDPAPPVVVAPDPPPVVVVPDPPPQSPPTTTPAQPPSSEPVVPPSEISQPSQSAPIDPATIPRYLVFDPSPDHDANVTSYTFEVWRGDATVEVLVHDLGKPPVVAGECQVDVADWLRQLPAGSYMGVVKAVNGYGASAGAPSAPFSIQ